MDTVVLPHSYSGSITIPASKSHTIRRLLIASLADGVSTLIDPLDSLDARSCAAVCAGLGAKITFAPSAWTVNGLGSAKKIDPAGRTLDVGNSGTTLYLALAIAALSDKTIMFTGDAQIARRSALPLLKALSALGVAVSSSADGCIPVTVRGPLQSGRISLDCPTSQYLSAMLLAAPLAPQGTSIEIEVPQLNERPYIEMTLSYLDAQGVHYQTNAEFSYFKLAGGAAYHPVSGPVSGDFSSAAFPALAAAISGGSVQLANLDPNDPQGDKIFFEILAAAGCTVVWQQDSVEISCRGTLQALSLDLNATPDLLPACAVLGAFSEGETRLYNVAHARIKETDRIAVMAHELSKLGVHCVEQADGLIIHGLGRRPDGGSAPLPLDGHGDHRVVMALAAAGLAFPGGVVIAGSEAADITYPNFLATLA